MLCDVCSVLVLHRLLMSTRTRKINKEYVWKLYIVPTFPVAKVLCEKDNCLLSYFRIFVWSLYSQKLAPCLVTSSAEATKCECMGSFSRGLQWPKFGNFTRPSEASIWSEPDVFHMFPLLHLSPTFFYSSSNDVWSIYNLPSLSCH
jgi:hypothetical protein